MGGWYVGCEGVARAHGPSIVGSLWWVHRIVMLERGVYWRCLFFHARKMVLDVEDRDVGEDRDDGERGEAEEELRPDGDLVDLDVAALAVPPAAVALTGTREAHAQIFHVEERIIRLHEDLDTHSRPSSRAKERARVVSRETRRAFSVSSAPPPVKKA